jgi:carbon monoxide dehydrogenase subunit G
MGMTKYESSIKQVAAPQERVYAMLSDMNNLERFKQALPEDKVKNLSFDTDNIYIDTPPVGKVTLQVTEREPMKCIKLQTISSPLPMTLWIQIVSALETESKLKLTIGIEANPLIRGMIEKPLKEALEKMAEMLAILPYNY